MAKSSLHLIAECQQRGLISKEAAAKILSDREQLLKQAMRGAAKRLFGAMRGGKHPAHEAAEALPAVGKRMRDKMSIGGLTGVGGKSESRAQWSDVAANLGKMMALAGLTAGATAGIGGVIRHSKDKKLRGEIDKSYNKMFVEHPGLKDIEEHDPGRVRRHFGVLARYAPSLAADPTVAGTWVQATSQVGQINTGDIKNLAETQSRIDDAREDRGKISIAPMKISDFSKAITG
jgi:hypothetical protein